MTTKDVKWFVAHVTDQLGQHEHPLGSNNTKYGRRFGWNDVAWCSEFGYEMYADAGVTLPLKTASCVAIYDAAVRDDLHYASDYCIPGDSVIRTWQRLGRHAPGFNPAETHYQIVVDVKVVNRQKMLGLIGGNQGAGYVGPGVEWVPAGDATILGGLAFHRLFHVALAASKPVMATRQADAKTLPAAKSHPHVVTDPTPKRLPGRRVREQAAAWRRLVRKIKRGW